MSTRDPSKMVHLPSGWRPQVENHCYRVTLRISHTNKNYYQLAPPIQPAVNPSPGRSQYNTVTWRVMYAKQVQVLKLHRELFADSPVLVHPVLLTNIQAHTLRIRMTWDACLQCCHFLWTHKFCNNIHLVRAGKVRPYFALKFPNDATVAAPLL